jgi:ankyrin repeat protein
MTRYSVDECEAAFNNAEIDEDTLIRMFRSCTNPDGLVERAIDSDHERAVQLLISPHFCKLTYKVYEDEEDERASYGCRLIDMLLLAEWNDGKRSEGVLPWYFAYNNVEGAFAHLIASGIDVNACYPSRFSLSHRAAQNKNEKLLSMLIDAGADVTAPDRHGNTPCHYAAMNPNAAVIALLIPLSDVNARNDGGEPPCLWAKTSPVLELLMAAGANVHAVDNESYSALSWAVEDHDDKMVELLVDAGVDLNTVGPRGGSTAMHVAAKRCNHRLLGKLIAAGRNVNAACNLRKTPLHMFQDADNARGDDAVRSMAMLIAAGADVHAVDECDATPLHGATIAGFVDCMSLLLNAGADAKARNKRGESPLHFAKNVDAAAMLIAAGANVNAVDASRRTACHCAWKRPQLLSCLIAAGANVNAKDDGGQTALHYAARSDDQTIDSISILIDAGINIDQGNDAGNCAGHWAVLHGRVENLKFLLARGAQVDKQNNNGETMLLVAANEHNVEIVKVLIDAGADLNVRSRKFISPLHEALERNVEIATLLLRAGASVNGVGPRGCSACHVAARSQYHAVQSLRLVLAFGANVHAVDDHGASVAHGAHASTIPLLRSLGVNLNGVDDRGNTVCHAACDGAVLVELFAVGVTMTAKNKAGATPFEFFLTKQQNDDAASTCVAAGIGVGVQTQLESHYTDIIMGAVVIAGGGFVLSHAGHPDEMQEITEGALSTIFWRQKQMFRLRALEVCLGLQSLRVSALEMYEILAYMFAPLECVVPFSFAWRVVCAVKH